MNKTKKEKKSRINVYCTKEEYEKLKEIAERRRQSLSGFLLYVGLKEEIK